MLITWRFNNKAVTFTHLKNQVRWSISWWRNKALYLELHLSWRQVISTKYHTQSTDKFTQISSPTTKHVVESLPCAYLSVFYLVCNHFSASYDSNSQAIAYWFSYAFFLLQTNEAINKGEKKVSLSKQHQSSGAGNGKQLPEEENAFIANSTNKLVVSSS
jgi:hypothetical protein